MTIQKLRSVRAIRQEADDLSERIERLRSAAERTTAAPSITGFGGNSGGGDRMADQAAKLVDLIARRQQRLIYLEMQCEDVEVWLDGLDAVQRMVLRLRYISGLAWSAVAKETHYSADHCLRVHRSAIQYCTDYCDAGDHASKCQ